MLTFIIKRTLLFIPVVWGVITLTFILMFVVPGDPVLSMVGERYDEATVEQLREELHLDEPMYMQYGRFFWNLLHGDLGHSYITNRPVLDTILDKFPKTMLLAGAAMLVSVILGLSVGIVSSLKPYSWFDKGSMVIALGGISAPVFWVGLMLVLIFGIQLRWFPSSGYGGLAFLVLPAITLGTRSSAFLARVTRATMLEVKSKDFMRTAKAKGLPKWIIILKHQFVNTLIPVITIIGVDFGSYLSGAVLTESIFGWPGIGRLALDSILKRDFPMIQGTVLVTALVFITVNFLVDLLYGVVDPRIRYDE